MSFYWVAGLNTNFGTVKSKCAFFFYIQNVYNKYWPVTKTPTCGLTFCPRFISSKCHYNENNIINYFLRYLYVWWLVLKLDFFIKIIFVLESSSVRLSLHAYTHIGPHTVFSSFLLLHLKMTMDTFIVVYIQLFLMILQHKVSAKV